MKPQRGRSGIAIIHLLGGGVSGRAHGGAGEGRAEFESLEAHLGLRHYDGFGDASIQADTQSDQTGEGDQIRIQSAKKEKEAEGFGYEISEEERVNPAISGRAVFIIAVK